MSNRWKEAQAKNTIIGYEEFLRDYPKGEYSNFARKKIFALSYDEAVKANTLLAYEDLLRRHFSELDSWEKNKYANEIQKNLEKLYIAQGIFQAIRKIKLEIDQIYRNEQGGTINTHLPLDKTINQILQQAGFETNEEKYEAILKITIVGKTWGYFTRARVDGNIFFITTNGRHIKRSFIGLKNFDPAFIRRLGENKSPEKAIFDQTLYGDANFYWVFANMMKDVFGNKVFAFSLIAAFDSTDKKYLAQKELLLIGPEAVEPLISSLNDKNENIRNMAIETLGEIKDHRAVKPLIAALNDGKNESRIAAANALGAIKNISAVEPLIASLKDKDYGVRSSAISALGHIGDYRALEPIIAALNDAHIQPRVFAARALGEIKDIRGAKALIQAIKKDFYDWNFKRTARKSIIGMGELAQEALSLALNDKDRNLRGEAVMIMGNIRNERSVEILINLLNDTDMFVKSLAIVALKKVGDKKAENIISSLTEKDLSKIFNRTKKVESGQERQSEEDATERLNTKMEISKKFKMVINEFAGALADMDLEEVATQYANLIKKGQSGTEYLLILALFKHGDLGMGNAFLQSGNEFLFSAGRYWGEELNSYTIIPTQPSSGRPVWGSQ